MPHGKARTPRGDSEVREARAAVGLGTQAGPVILIRGPRHLIPRANPVTRAGSGLLHARLILRQRQDVAVVLHRHRLRDLATTPAAYPTARCELNRDLMSELTHPSPALRSREATGAVGRDSRGKTSPRPRTDGTPPPHVLNPQHRTGADSLPVRERDPTAATVAVPL